MRSNEFFMLLIACVLTGTIVAVTALADVNPPADPYQHISAVELADSQTPQVNGGFNSLGGDEHQYRESLPIQLSGPVKKVSGHGRSHGKASAHAKHGKKSVKKSKGKKGKASKKSAAPKNAKAGVKKT